jgi:hypothetical protein
MVDGEVLVRYGVLVDGGREKENEIIRHAQAAIRGIRERCKAKGSDIKGKLKGGWTSV